MHGPSGVILKESSKAFYRVNYAQEMPEDMVGEVNEKLSATEWYETYEEASQAAKDMFKGTAEELYRPDAGDILLAPSDYGSKRYCTNVDRGLKAEIIGFELLGKNGKMAITMSAEEK